jgi:serine/threonine protein kinase
LEADLARKSAKRMGNVRLDPEKVEHRMNVRQMPLEVLQDRLKAGPTKIDHRRIKTAVEGNACHLATANLIARELGLQNCLDLLPGVVGEELLDELSGPENRFGEWQIVEVLSEFREIANGLQYELSMAVDRLRPDRYGRCKRYNLRYTKGLSEGEIRERLSRHPDVCDSLARHPFFPQNKRADFHSPDYFWVVDAWEAGKTLSETVASKPLKGPLLGQVMLELAEALQALHDHGIVRRELTPEFILLRETDSSVLLTDLELAKILERAKTVSKDWRENPYVAFEVFGGKCDFRTDVFSWGQILYYAATGKEPEKIPDPAVFFGVELPSSVKKIAMQCVERMPGKRPKDMNRVLKTIRKAEWT